MLNVVNLALALASTNEESQIMAQIASLTMQVHSEGAVRHAEKRRRGTCEFANRIARIALEQYEATVPKSCRDVHKQTCVAAIVACFKPESTNEINLDDETPACNGSTSDLQNSGPDHMQVMGLGVGTKFLSSTTLQDEPNNCTRIRDCHAEVLARRAFRRQLLHEIKNELNDTRLADTKYLPILERIQHADQPTASEAKRLKPCAVDYDGTKIDRGHRFKYRLKPGVTLHFYASSAPCGNATLKKFVKMEKETFDPLLVRTCAAADGDVTDCPIMKLIVLFTTSCTALYSSH
jgi:hypothetical protein